jgi:hypothetical protein
MFANDRLGSPYFGLYWQRSTRLDWQLIGTNPVS